MIVKNEEKYLERCLTALKPILEQVDSELIIADTGSADRTVEIAKKFTDNVYYFEWINDFAAARNSTLERAKGRWYMFLDADEILQDCSDIIQFFNSGEYKKYGSAAMIIRNYKDSVLVNEYSDFKSCRLTAIKGGVKFRDPVHEQLRPAFEPCRELRLVADHYGYVYYDNGVPNEFAKQKSERNLELLQSELAKQGASSSIYNQIADCYGIIGDAETALEYRRKGMALTDPRSMTAIMCYSKILTALWNLNRHEETKELCGKYFSKENTARRGALSTDCFVYLARARANFELKNFGAVVPDIVRGFELYDKFMDGKLNTDDLLVTEFKVTTTHIRYFADALSQCCRIAGKDGEAAEIINRFPNIRACLSDSKNRHLSMSVASVKFASAGQPDRKDSKKAVSPKSEFQKLAEQFKKNIRAMIDAGDTAQAQALIAEYAQLCPNDPEINELKEHI